MRKYYRNTIAALLCVISLINSNIALAYDFEQDGYYFNIISDSAVELAPVAQYTGTYNSECVEVPSTVSYDGKTYIVSAIGEYAFTMSSCISVKIPASVTVIRDHAFDFAYMLTEIALPSGITEIGSFAFGGTALKEFVIPASVTYIGYGAFASMTQLTTFSVESGNISYEGYKGLLYNSDCTTLVAFPSGLSEVPSFPVSVTHIGPAAFYASSISSVNLPSGIVSIGQEAFYCCYSLSDISLPSSVSELGEKAFSGCYYLSRVNLSSSLKVIGDECFAGCGVSTVEFPHSLEYIGDRSFENSALSGTVVIPASVVEIGTAAFNGCRSLKEFRVTEGNNEFVAVDGILYTKGKKTLLSCPGALGIADVEVAEGCEEIAPYAFYSLDWLKTIRFSDDVHYIGEHAFSMSYLTDIVFGKGIREIGDYAFQACVFLKEISLPDSTSILGDYSFTGCSLLSKFTLGRGLVEIGERAFQSLPKLKEITIPFTVRTIGNEAFAYTALETIYAESDSPATLGNAVFDVATLQSGTLYVPIGKTDSYRSTDGWKDFVVIEEYESPYSDVDDVMCDTDNDDNDIIYDLQGRRIIKPTRGMLIIRDGKLMLAQ